MKQLSELQQKQSSLTAEYESAKQQLSQSEKTASQYDRYMTDDYSKIVEQVRAEQQAAAEAIQQRQKVQEAQQERNNYRGYYRE